MTDAVRYLEAIHLHTHLALDPGADPMEVSIASVELDSAREDAGDLDRPPVLIRLADALLLDDDELALLEVLAVLEGEEPPGLGWSLHDEVYPLERLIEDKGMAFLALRVDGPLRTNGLIVHTSGRFRVLPDVAAVLLDPGPTDQAMADAGLSAALGIEVWRGGPFEDDLDFFEDAFGLVRLWTERHDAVRAVDRLDDASRSARQSLARARSAEARIGEARGRLDERVEATREAGLPLPRLIELAERTALSRFERDVLIYLCCLHASPDVRRHHGTPDVEDLLTVLTTTFREAVAGRSAFYRDAPLVVEGVIEVDVSHGNLGSASVEVDPRVVDHLLGIDTEAHRVGQGSHLFTPAVDLEAVHLPAADKERILETAAHFGAFERARADLGLDDRLAYGRGLVLLFHGAPGTGKTMMAHALAAHLGRKLLLVNEGPGFFRDSSAMFRGLLREARLHGAVLFFDEAEGFFGDHEPALLTEIERHDGLVVLATNQPERIDDAMRRRCTLAVRFEEPGPELRRRIWDGLLPEVALEDGVDLDVLARRYALPGGHVKNAVLTALAAAAARAELEDVPVRIQQGDLEVAAEGQVRSRLAGTSVGAVVPTGGLDRLVLDDEVAQRLGEVVALERARPAVLREWGFGARDEAGGRGLYGRSTAVLLEGPPGTGKTAAASALAFDLGRPLHLVTADAVMDKYVGETSKQLRSAFEVARAARAVLLLDEADALLAARGDVRSATDRYANADTNVLLGLIERHEGLVVLTTNRAEGLDPALRRRLWLSVRLESPPAALRARLWRLHLPAACPLGDDVDLEALAERHALTGAEIERAAYRAAAGAAVRGGVVGQDDLEGAAVLEGGAERVRAIGFAA